MRKIIFISLIGVISLLILTFPFYIKVKTECKTQYGPCPLEISQKINSSGKSIYTTKNKVKKILKNDQLVMDFGTQFKLPSTLLINLVVKKPVFAIISNDPKLISLVDSQGRVLGTTNTSALPTVVNTNSKYKPGETVSSQDLLALNLIQGVYQMYQVNKLVVENNSLVVELPSQIKVLFPLSGERDLILGTLRLVYTKVTSGEQAGKYKEIDLRFKNPILR